MVTLRHETVLIKHSFLINEFLLFSLPFLSSGYKNFCQSKGVTPTWYYYFTYFIYRQQQIESESRSVVSNFLQPHGLYGPWNSPGQNTGVGSLSLLLGIFPTQGLNPGLPCSQAGKEYACNAGDPGSIPGSGRSPGEGLGYPLQYSWAFLLAQLVKNPPAMRETWVRSLGWEDPLEKGERLPTAVFWPGEFHGLQSMESPRVGYN